MKIWFVLMGVNAALFGVFLLVAPVAFLSLVESPWAGSLAQPVARLLGAQTCGYALLSLWSARIEHAETLRMILAIFLMVDLLGLGVTIWGVAAGDLNALGYSVVAAHAVAVVGWAFFLRRA